MTLGSDTRAGILRSPCCHLLGNASRQHSPQHPPKSSGITATAFVQSDSECVRVAVPARWDLNSQLQAADTLELVQEWSLRDGLRALSPELVDEDATRERCRRAARAIRLATLAVSLRIGNHVTRESAS